MTPETPLATWDLHPLGGDLWVTAHSLDPARLVDLRSALLLGLTDVLLLTLEPDLAGEGARDLTLIERDLATPELLRLQAIAHPRARAEFLAGRALIRHGLSRIVGVSPRTLEIHESPRGALTLPPDLGPWHFNLSHTDGLVVLAVALHPVGVDVEPLTRSVRAHALAHRYFAPAECEALLALPEAQQTDRFLALWTLKEAYIKARGLGLQIPLASFAFTFAPTLALTPSPDDPTPHYHLLSADLASSHRLGLCLAAPLLPPA